MKALIIDDEEQARGMMAYYLKEFFSDIQVVGSAETIQDGARIFYECNPDIVFLDITMPKGSGFDLMNQVDFSDSFVVFVTAHTEYALEAIKVSAFDYLLKPLQINELTRVINKVRGTIRKKSFSDLPDPKIKLKYGGKILLLSSDDIVYAKSEGNYTQIFLADKSVLLITKNIKKVEEEYLVSFPFFRTHQSFIINLRMVREFDANEIKLKNDLLIPVSKNRFEDFKQMIDLV